MFEIDTAPHLKMSCVLEKKPGIFGFCQVVVAYDPEVISKEKLQELMREFAMTLHHAAAANPQGFQEIEIHHPHPSSLPDSKLN